MVYKLKCRYLNKDSKPERVTLYTRYKQDLDFMLEYVKMNRDVKILSMARMNK